MSITEQAHSANVEQWQPTYDLRTFGDTNDGVIEIVTRTLDGGRSEAGCYYGQETHPHYPVIAISVATGCRFRCAFCNTRLQPGRPLSAEEMVQQTMLIIRESCKRGVAVDSNEGIKINIGKTGEPMENPNLVAGMKTMMEELRNIRFKIATVFPIGKLAKQNFDALSAFSSSIDCTVQMQISLISTRESYRKEIAGAVAPFADISLAAEQWRAQKPPRPQWNLNLILAEETPCDPADILPYFPPEHFQIRPRDCIPTENAVTAGLTPISEDRHRQLCTSLRDAGYTVNLAGRPTQTEKKNRLAANATRFRTRGEST